MKIIFTIIFSILIISLSAQQDTLDYRYIDAKTYEYFQAKEWKKLIKLGKTSLKKNIDFYYLQTRMGIAYYEKKQYRKAIKYFKTAYSRNPDDDVVAEYLYFSYLFSGRRLDAMLLSSKLNDNLKKKIRLKNSIIKSASLSGIYQINDKQETLANLFENPDDSLYAENQYDKMRTSYSAGFEHRIGNRILMNYQFSQAFSTERQQMRYLDKTFDFDLKNSQINFYANSKINLASGLNISLSGNYIHVKSSTNYFDNKIETINLTEINRYDLANDIKLDIYDTIFNYTDSITVNTENKQDSWDDYAFSLSLWKNFSNFKIGLHTSYYKVNSQKFLQPALSLIYFPFGNLNLYSITEINDKISKLPSERGQGQGRKNISTQHEFVFSQKFGVKLHKNIWTEFSYKYGNMQNYIDNEALTVYNLSESIKMQANGGFIFMLMKNKLELSLNYSLIQKEHTFQSSYISDSFSNTYSGILHKKFIYPDGSVYWIDGEEFTVEKTVYTEDFRQTKTLYFNHLITGGLKWYF